MFLEGNSPISYSKKTLIFYIMESAASVIPMCLRRLDLEYGAGAERVQEEGLDKVRGWKRREVK